MRCHGKEYVNKRSGTRMLNYFIEKNPDRYQYKCVYKCPNCDGYHISEKSKKQTDRRLAIVNKAIRKKK